MTKHPPEGRGQSHMTHFRFRRPHLYLQNGTAEARVAKFCVQIEYIKCRSASLWMTDYPDWRGQGKGHVIRFFIFCPQSYLCNW